MPLRNEVRSEASELEPHDLWVVLNYTTRKLVRYTIWGRDKDHVFWSMLHVLMLMMTSEVFWYDGKWGNDPPMLLRIFASYWVAVLLARFVGGVLGRK